MRALTSYAFTRVSSALWNVISNKPRSSGCLVMCPRPIHRTNRSIWRGMLRKTGSVLTTLIWALWLSHGIASADPVETAAAHLADQSFQVLTALNKQSTGAGSNPLLGPMATFAADADTLNKSLVQHDADGASSAVKALQSDQVTIDQTMKAHPEALNPSDWTILRQQVAALAKKVPSSPVESGSSAHVPSAAPAPTPALSAEPPMTETATSSATDQRTGPQIVITSRQSDGDAVRLRGYFEGYALKSAGIYDGSSELRAFKVNDVHGEQRVEFDLRLGGASTTTLLRVADADGRTAEAPALASADTESNEPSTGELASAAPLGSEPGGGTIGGASGSTAEIPSHGPFTPSPSKRHMLGAHLGNVRVDIAQVVELADSPPTYQVVGQIHGPGVTHAGVYVDGRLVEQIAIAASTHLTSFSERFIDEGGPATIRAYGIGSQFTETPIDIAETADNSIASTAPAMPAAPMAVMPSSGPAIQITAVTAVATNLYSVSGVITGANMASAGLYQNGVLAQNISVNGGFAGLLGALLPRNYRRVNFTTRFNPYVGPATIRAFDSDGGFNEQPIIVAGVSSPYNPGYAVNPYSAMNPNSAMNPSISGSTIPYTGPGSSRPMLPSRPLW
jgi:hypothetical protein